MKVVTVATHSFGYFPILVESCKRNNIDLTVLGWNETWTNFQFKFQQIRQFLNKVRNETEWIVYIDAFDVLVLGDMSKLEKRLKKIDKEGIDFVIALDKFTTKMETIVCQTFYGNFEGFFLNAGMFATKKERFLDMINSIEQKNQKKKNYDDQSELVWYLNNAKNKDRIFIDFQNNIFYNAYVKHLILNKTIFKNGRIYSIETKKFTDPIFIHFPGNQDFKYICEFLGYQIPEQTRKDTSFHNKIEYHRKTRSILVNVFLGIFLVLFFILFLFAFALFWIREEWLLSKYPKNRRLYKKKM